MNIRITKKVVSTIVAGCLLLSLGTAALAKNAPQDQPPPPPACPFAAPGQPPDPAGRERHLTQALAELVKAETISQEQAGKLLDFFKQQAEEQRQEMEKRQQKKQNFIHDLQQTAGLSEAQAKAVADALRPPHRPDRQECAPDPERHPM